MTENLRRFWAFHLASALGFDLPRAVGNAVLVLLVGHVRCSQPSDEPRDAPRSAPPSGSSRANLEPTSSVAVAVADDDGEVAMPPTQRGRQGRIADPLQLLGGTAGKVVARRRAG